MSSIPMKHVNRPGIRPTGEYYYGENYKSSKNFVIPLILSIIAVVLVVLIGIFIIWFYLRRRNRKEKSPIQFTDPPPLYSDTVNTNDTFMADRTSSA